MNVNKLLIIPMLMALLTGCASRQIDYYELPPSESKVKFYPDGYSVIKTMMKADNFHGGFWYVAHQVYRDNEEAKYTLMFTDKRYEEILGRMYQRDKTILVIPIKAGEDPFSDKKMDTSYKALMDIGKREITSPTDILVLFYRELVKDTV